MFLEICFELRVIVKVNKLASSIPWVDQPTFMVRLPAPVVAHVKYRHHAVGFNKILVFGEENIIAASGDADAEVDSCFLKIRQPFTCLRYEAYKLLSAERIYLSPVWLVNLKRLEALTHQLRRAVSQPIQHVRCIRIAKISRAVYETQRIRRYSLAYRRDGGISIHCIIKSIDAMHAHK